METIEKHLSAAVLAVDWSDGTPVAAVVSLKNGMPSVRFVHQPDLRRTDVDALAKKLSAELHMPVVHMSPEETTRATSRRRKLN